MSIKEQVEAAKAPTVIRHAGQPNRIIIDDKEILRQEKMVIPKIGMVTCAPYDNHFVYRYAKKKGWTLFCTCGSAAVITGYDAYKPYGSNTGAMVGCYHFLLNGCHADGSS